MSARGSMAARRGLQLATMATCVGLLLAGAPDSGVAVVAEETGATRVEPATTPSEEDERLRDELAELARAWMLGGGEFGYPFWEKAGQRWTGGQVTTPIYREYSTGYRDRLRAGCELLDSLDVDADVAREVRSLIEDSCRRRIEALRAQQRWLDTLIELDVPATPAGTPADQEAEAERIAELQATAAEHESAYREALQDSYRGARLAMTLAQSALDARGLERLPEDAFI